MMNPTDEELAEYIEIQNQIKILNKRLEYIKEKCKMRGTFYSKNYACIVAPQTRETIASLPLVLKYFPREKLEGYGLIFKNTFLLVKVSPLIRSNSRVIRAE